MKSKISKTKPLRCQENGWHNISESLENIVAPDRSIRAKSCVEKCAFDAEPERRTCYASSMPLKLKKTVAEMVAEANAEVETIPAADAIKLKDDPNILLVDIRDIRELDRDGRVPGALHAPRGMLEFWVDPATPYHREVFASGKKFLFFCAAGGRSALAAQTLQQMGLEPVAHIGGGFAAWKAAGGPIDTTKKT